jgi:hypothetical protein
VLEKFFMIRDADREYEGYCPYQVIPYSALPEYSEPPTAQVQAWMSTGEVGGYAVNAFGPRQLATAKHIGVGVGALVHLNDGTQRHVTAVTTNPDGHDVSVLTVDGDLPTWSTVTPMTNWRPADAMFIAGGMTGGAEVRDVANELRGWYWAGQAGTLHWTRTSIKYAKQPTEQYEVGFDPEAGSFAMTGGDSGGGFYIMDTAGDWHLQGIGVGIYSHNGSLLIDGAHTSQFKPATGATNVPYSGSEMAMPRTWLRSLLPTPGDTDFSGAVDFADLVALARNYGDAGSWSGGDFNGDGLVDFFDLTELAQNYGGGPLDISDFERFGVVPEPTLTALVVAAPALLLRRSRRPVH